MKKLFLFGFMVWSVLFTANCQRTDSTSPAPGEDYFPLQIGNTWHYQNDFDNRWQIEVTGRQTIGIYNYFVIEGRLFPYDQDSLSYFRKDNAGRVYINFEDHDYLYADFDGSNWETYNSMHSAIEVEDLTVAIPAGTFHNCLQILFDNPQMVDEEMVNDYAPGVGLVRSRGFFSPIYLTSAFIGGTYYPDQGRFPDTFLETGQDADYSYISLQTRRRNNQDLLIEIVGWGIEESGLFLHSEIDENKLILHIMGDCLTIPTETWLKTSFQYTLSPEDEETLSEIRHERGQDSLVVLKN